MMHRCYICELTEKQLDNITDEEIIPDESDDRVIYLSEGSHCSNLIAFTEESMLADIDEAQAWEYIEDDGAEDFVEWFIGDNGNNEALYLAQYGIGRDEEDRLNTLKQYIKEDLWHYADWKGKKLYEEATN